MWALKFAPPMPPQLLGTLFGLADHADKHGRSAYPSVPTLAAYACKSERSVQRDLKELGKLGLIRLGDQSAAAHIPLERRPCVYDLAIENTVPGGRAGDDEVTWASRVTLASSRARGGRKTAAHPKSEVTSTSPVTPTSPPDVHVTPGVTPTSEWGDAHVATGVTPTSPKPPYEPPTNRPMNQSVAKEGRESTGSSAREPQNALSLIPADWQPTEADRQAAAADIKRLGPAATDRATAKFVRHHQSVGTRRANFGPAWVTWLSRERAETQGAFLVGLPGGGQPTPTPSSFAERMAEIEAAAARDDRAASYSERLAARDHDTA